MPKKSLHIFQLPADKPDCCSVCPLCGLIPKERREKGSKETRVCIGTMEALTERGIAVRASQRDSHHPLRRPCDDRWESWMQLPGRKLGLSTARYLIFRIPYENSLELKIKFHR